MLNFFPINRVISGNYTAGDPDNYIIFNAHLVANNLVFWSGDLNISKESDQLIQLAKRINSSFFILHEADAKFSPYPKIRNALFLITSKEIHKLCKI